jgi:predicted esterase YcpF (UPF0227 family)
MTDKTAIIVFHGFGSKIPNSLAKALIHSPKISRDNFAVITPQFDYNNQLGTQSYVDKMIESYLAQPEISEVILVGSSFGGFWAHYVAKKYNLKCVLVNPALKIAETCKRCNIDEENTNHYLSLEKQFEVSKYRRGVYVEAFVGEKDDVINPFYAFQQFPVTTLMSNEGHRVNNFEEIINSIIRASNNLSQ